MLGAQIAVCSDRLDRDAFEEFGSEYTSFLLVGPCGGPPDALRGRMLPRFRAKDTATDSQGSRCASSCNSFGGFT